MKEHWLNRWEEEREAQEDELAKRMPEPTPAPIEREQRFSKEHQVISSLTSTCPNCGCRDIANSGTCPNCEIFIEVVINDPNETEMPFPSTDSLF